MNPYIASAVAEMDKINISKLEHPGDEAMDPSSCRFIAAFARALKARKVLEFGSGFTSLLLAREIETVEDNYLLSIDDSAAFSAQAREAFETSGCRTRAEFRVAPLRPRFYGPRLLLSYSLPKGLLEALGPFDLVLIDTPHHEFGREAVFYDAFRAVAPGGYVVMDDANLPKAEKVCVPNWRAAFGDAVDPILLEGIGEGLSVVEKVDERVPRYTAKGALPAGFRTLGAFGRLLLARD